MGRGRRADRRARELALAALAAGALPTLGTGRAAALRPRPVARAPPFDRQHRTGFAAGAGPVPAHRPRPDLSGEATLALLASAPRAALPATGRTRRAAARRL